MLLGRRKKLPQPIGRILAVQLAGIGDSLLATPALVSLRKRYPEARLVLLVNRRAASIFEGWSFVDEVVALEMDLYYARRWGWCRPSALRTLWRTRRRLRGERFDLAVNLMQITSLRGALLVGLGLWALGARYRAGRDTDGRAAAFHLRTPETWPDSRHAVVKNLALVEALGCPVETGPLVIALTDEDRRAAERFLQAHGQPPRPLVALHPWVGDPARQWPLEAWGEVAEALSTRYGATIVVLGGPQDRQAAEGLAQKKSSRLLVACGALSLRETAALIERCDLFLGVLSGALHMAASVWTPIVACYPQELVGAYAPYTDPARYRLLTTQAQDVPLSQIPPEAMVEAAGELLKQKKSPPPEEVLHWYKTDEPASAPKPWSVAHIITRLDRGGSTDNTLLTVLGLDPVRYRVTLIAGLTTEPSSLVRRLLERPDIDVRFLPSLIRAMRPLRDLRALFELYRICRRERFDLVHTHSSKAGILGRWAARLAGCRLLVHTPHGHVFTGYYGPLVSRIFVWVERFTARITDAIITLTPKGIEDHLAWRIAPEGKFLAVPSGVELEGFGPAQGDQRLEARRALGLPTEGLVVGSIGRLDWVKGYDHLVEASALVLRKKADVTFAVAGEGPERRALEEQARRLGVADRWRFMGWKEEVAAIYRAFDLSVLPSRNEGMGRTAVESMACGLPVVATAVGGLPSVVKDGVTGLLVEPGHPRALADAIVKLLDDEAARQRMGAAGPTRALEHFSKEVMIKGIEGLYGRLLGSAEKPAS